MAMLCFTPLHVHSHYSLLEGVDSPDVLLRRAAACGYRTLALTDSNNLYGAVAFMEAARRYGIRPILGACLRQRKVSSEQWTVGSARFPGRPLPTAHCPLSVTALIAEPSGYQSLCRILSRLHLQENPSLVDLLVENPQGLHVLVDDAVLVDRLIEAFGHRLWLEIVRPPPHPHPLSPKGRGGRVQGERALLEAGRRRGVQPVASIAAHFATPEGYPTFRLLTAVRQGLLLEQVPADLPITPAHHLVDVETMYQRFRDLPEAIVNAEQLAEQCRSDVLPRGITLPAPRVPHVHDALSYLRLLCERGLRRRKSVGWAESSRPTIKPTATGMLVGLEDSAHPTALRTASERLEEELHIIRQRGLAGYFLVVRQIAREARRRNFSMALRGSAGNSLICYLLSITDVDPLRFELPLERFLHAGRLDLPDIDLDFDWRERDEMIASVFARYGAAHTAMISSHLFLQPRSAFREAAKVHGLSNEQISQVIESLAQRVDAIRDPYPPPVVGPASRRSLTGETPVPPAGKGGGLETVPKTFPLEPARWPRLLADARRLLDRPRHLSVHPGGIVLTPDPIENYVPLQRAAKGVVITQFEKDAVEQIGLVKIDLLGNRALSTVSEARRRLDPVNRKIAATAADRHDARTLDLLRRGDTLGVNQLESPAMRHLLIQMRPRNMLDVIQALALIRPGAASIGAKEKFIRRRRGLEPVQHLHPYLEPLLRDSCGLMLYEDDALRVVQALTGLSAPEADRFRKQITKSESAEEILALSKAFLAACDRNGIDRKSAEETWVQLAKFNSYSFCRSHSISYGMIAWQAAFLKAHFPLVFWTAALNNNQGMYPRRVYVEAAKNSGIPFFLPCVNRSPREFTIEENGIRTGLGCIRSLDEATMESILADRERRGLYQGLIDFQQRINAGPETLALLIQVGAFDFTNQSRASLMLEAALEEVQPEGASLFTGGTGVSPVGDGRDARLIGCDPWPFDWKPTDYSQVRQWKEEWERLGFLAGPPVMELFRPFLPQGLHDSRCLNSLLGRPIRLAGLVATGRHTETKNGEEMQFVTLEDEWGLVDVTLFPRICPPLAHLSMGPYLVEGEVEEQYGVLTITARRFYLALERQASPAQK
jgi:DNA-directed DNA polymerase III PolC